MQHHGFTRARNMQRRLRTLARLLAPGSQDLGYCCRRAHPSARRRRLYGCAGKSLAPFRWRLPCNECRYPRLESELQSGRVASLKVFRAGEILKSDKSCISNPKSEILNWTVNCGVQLQISKFRI